jgi:hypothetical protein
VDDFRAEDDLRRTITEYLEHHHRQQNDPRLVDRLIDPGASRAPSSARQFSLKTAVEPLKNTDEH